MIEQTQQPSEPGTNADPTVLSVANISKRFGGVTALSGVDFDLRAGEVHGLVGENGAGKSTMMKVLAGVHTDYEGELILRGKPVRFSSPADAQNYGIGMVHQELSIFPHLSVAENIFGKRVLTRNGVVSWKRLRARAQELVSELGLAIDVTATMGALPVGNQQLIEISRVISSGASIIILDEPTSALSAPETERLFKFMDMLKNQGKTLVFISHFLDDVMATTDRVTVFKNSRKISTVVTSSTSKHELVKLMIGGDSQRTAELAGEDSSGAAVQSASGDTDSGNTEYKAQGPVMLDAQSLTKHGAFNDISLQMHRGEILGLFAFMGAGQAQLARCLFGAEPIDDGKISLENKAIKLRSPVAGRKAGIAFVPEDRRNALMLRQEIFKNVTIAHLAKLIPVWLNQKQELKIAKEQIKDVGVRPADPMLPVGALSGGNQQKVVLAKWLTKQPKVLILSEPTRGMDVGAKEEVMGIIRRLRDEGVAILLVTTEPEAILSMADRALVMRKGELSAELHGPALTKQALMGNA